MKIASNTLKRNKVNVFRLGKTLHWDIKAHPALPDVVFLPTAIRRLAQTLTHTKKVVVIYGEPGSEFAEVAAFIFLHTRSLHAGYREFHPDSYHPTMLSDILQHTHRNHGITLLFDEFDEFSREQQQDVLTQLKMQPVLNRSSLSHVRVIFSLRQTPAQPSPLDLPERVWGLGVDCASLGVPPLRERPDDVVELLTAACREFRQSNRQNVHPEVLHQLQQYAWPGNTRELRRSIARLLMLSDNVEIGLQQAHAILPDIINLSTEDASDPRMLATNQSLCDAVLKRDGAALRQFHPSVSKALLYLGEHFRREMTLAELADHAHISPSHLSYLLKQSLMLSFKQILNQTRISYACQQLEYHPLSRITNLYLDCGYGDLSHFEKMFKRYTGLTPNEFRRKLKPAIQKEGT